MIPSRDNRDFLLFRSACRYFYKTKGQLYSKASMLRVCSRDFESEIDKLNSSLRTINFSVMQIFSLLHFAATGSKLWATISVVLTPLDLIPLATFMFNFSFNLITILTSFICIMASFVTSIKIFF